MKDKIKGENESKTTTVMSKAAKHYKANGSAKLAKAKTKTKGKSKAKAPGIAPVPRNGPMISIRMRSEAQINRIRTAAGKMKLSINTWVCEVLDRASVAQ